MMSKEGISVSFNTSVCPWYVHNLRLTRGSRDSRRKFGEKTFCQFCFLFVRLNSAARICITRFSCRELLADFDARMPQFDA